MVSVLLGLLLGIGLAAPADAEADGKTGYEGKKQPHIVRGRRNYRYKNRSEYHELWAAKLPFASSSWWEQMVREDRVRR